MGGERGRESGGRERGGGRERECVCVRERERGRERSGRERVYVCEGGKRESGGGGEM